MKQRNLFIATGVLLLFLVVSGVFLLGRQRSPQTYLTPTPTSPILPTTTPKSTISPSITSQPTPSPVEAGTPIVYTPLPNTTVTNPLTIRGSVPSGWMFEGVFPVSLVNSRNEVIARGQAREDVAGSWSSGQRVSFTATIPFSTQEKSGFVVLEKDNPSGLPQNAASYKIPVNF